MARLVGSCESGTGGIVMPKVAEELMKILVCPQTKAALVQDGDWLYSTDPATRRRYPIIDGIPIMLIDQSQVVEPAEFRRVMGQAGVVVGQPA